MIGGARRPGGHLHPHARWWILLVAALGMAALLPGCGWSPFGTEGLPPATLGSAPPAAGMGISTRLDRSAVPQRYVLDLSIDPSQATLAGEITITVRLARATDRVRLHGQGLLIDMVQARVGGTTIPGEAAADAEGLLEARFPQILPDGDVDLIFRWRRGLIEAPRGVYRLRREDAWFAFTRFEPALARTAMPCFDQPDFKAPWQLTLRVPHGELAVANAPEASRNEDEDQTVFAFETTPPLPPHLLAFAVGDLEVTTLEAAARTDLPPLRLVGLQGRGHLAKMALRRAEVLLGWLADWTGIPVPYPKIDLLAVPEFPAGALESPGLLTFRETVLLVDDDSAPDARRLWSELALGHELAHLWLGDLVTPAWWDDLWLSEALATWLGTKAASATAPDLEANLQTVARTHWVMSLDEGGEAPPVRRPVTDVAGAEAAFDRMTYAKGAAVTRMVEAWLGPATLQNAIRGWLADHAHGHTTTAELVARIDQASGQQSGSVFAAFLDRTGVPLVRAELLCTPPGGPRVKLTIMANRGVPEAPSPVPVCVRMAAEPESVVRCTLLTGTETTLPAGDACPAWIHPNADQAGYYRWVLPEAALSALVEVHHESLTPAERVALPGQLEAMLEDGLIPIELYARAVSRLARSADIHPVALVQVVRTLARLHALVPEAGAPFAAWVRTLLEPQSLRMLEGDTGDAGEALRAVHRALAYLGQDRTLRSEATQTATAFLAAPGEADPTELNSVLPIAAWSGDDTLWEGLVSQLRAPVGEGEPEPLVRVAVISALGSFENPTLLRRSLGLLLDGTLGREDFLTVTRAISDAGALHEAWRWLTTHHAALVERLGADAAPDLAWMAAGLCGEEDAIEVERFFAQPNVNDPRTAANTRLVVREIRRCAALRDRIAEPLRGWLSANATRDAKPAVEAINQ